MATTTSTVSVEVVEVLGSRPESVLPDPTASRQVIDRARLSRARREGADVSSLVDAIAGARVFEQGGPLSERKLAVRGGGFDQTLVIVDGVVLGSPFATGLDVDLLGIEALESIELVRGGAGATLGDGALAGALLLTTRRAARAPVGALSVSYGAFETLRAQASGASALGAIAASFERTRGDFSYVSRLVALPDREERRENADATKGAVSAFLGTRVGGADVALAFGGGVRESGVPGLETQEQRFARESKRAAHLRVQISSDVGTSGAKFVADESSAKFVADSDAREGAKFVADSDAREGAKFVADSDAREGAKFVAEPVRVEAGLSAAFLGIDYRNDQPELAEASSTKFIALTTDARISFRPADAEAHFFRLALAFGGDGSSSTLHGEPRRVRASAAISDELTFERISLFAAMRAEKIGDVALAVLPRAGLTWRASERISFRAGAGRSLRAPAIDELYHPPELGFSGNPNLQAETAWDADAGLIYLPINELQLGATIFARHVEDGILYLNRNAFTVRPENFGDARIGGAELEARLDTRLFGFDTTLELAGTLLASRLIESTGPLPTRPPWGFAANAALTKPGAFGLYAITAATTIRALAPTWANLQSTQPIDLYARWDAALTFEPTARASIALSITNLLNDQTLESLHKLPLPGRAAFLTVRIATENEEDRS